MNCTYKHCIGFSNCRYCRKIWQENDPWVNHTFNLCTYWTSGNGQVYTEGFCKHPEGPLDKRTHPKLLIASVTVTIKLNNGNDYSVRDWINYHLPEYEIASKMLRRCVQLARDREGLAEELVGP